MAIQELVPFPFPHPWSESFAAVILYVLSGNKFEASFTLLDELCVQVVFDLFTWGSNGYYRGARDIGIAAGPWQILTLMSNLYLIPGREYMDEDAMREEEDEDGSFRVRE
jgi:hypothetical protein